MKLKFTIKKVEQWQKVGMEDEYTGTLELPPEILAALGVKQEPVAPTPAKDEGLSADELEGTISLVRVWTDGMSSNGKERVEGLFAAARSGLAAKAELARVKEKIRRMIVIPSEPKAGIYQSYIQQNNSVIEKYRAEAAKAAQEVGK